MFHHIVLMKFGAKADQQFLTKVEAYCDRIRAASPKPERYLFSRNIASRADGLNYGIVASFDSVRAHDTYQVSDVHQEMKSYMSPFIERIVVCDIDEDLV
jgi:hypothetical protein